MRKANLRTLFAELKLRNLLSSALMVAIFELMDMLSYSQAIFYNKDSSRAVEGICVVLYIYPTILSILFFNLFTSIRGGVVSSAIVENFRFFHKMSRRVHEETEDFEGFVTNSCFLFLATCLLFAASSLAMARLRLGRYISRIPKAVVYGIYATVGVIQIPIGLSQLMPDGAVREHLPM